MTKFTKEEISLCKQIAEKHRIKLENGAYFDDDFKEVKFICEDSYFQRLVIAQPDSRSFPLWTISDCLEFLRKKSAYLVFVGQERNKGWCEVNTKKIIHRHGGKTPLEACLKAVLAVLEEGK